MIYKIHERIVGRNMRYERTIKLLAVSRSVDEFSKNVKKRNIGYRYAYNG